MSAKGFGGIMFHGRDGLRSGYLEKEWEDGLKWSIDEAEKNGMAVWLYDEKHYPSGPVGNAIFRKYPERTMMSLVVLHEETIAAGQKFNFIIPDDVSIKFALAFSTDGHIQKLDCLAGKKEFSWINNSEQPMTILLLHVEREWPIPGQYFPFYPDYLDAEVSAEFIEMTHQWYVKRFRKKMGNTIKGIFTDNSCFNFGRIRRSAAWTPKLAERFKHETGLELESVLPGVFCRTAGFQRDRLVFWQFLGDEYLRTFVHPIRDICEQNQIDSTGHYCLEDGLAEHIRQIGDRFDLKRGQTVACVDMLGREIGEDLFETKNQMICAGARETADAAYYSNGSRVMCECLGLMGGWQLDLGEIKRATGFLAAQGIDIFVPHGLYYSIAGTRKWECIPDHFHNPMWNYYREWTEWISKISFLMAHSDRTGGVVLLYPATTLRSYIEVGVEFDPGNGIPASDRGTICDLTDFTFRTTVNNLVKNNIEFDIIDECLLQRADIRKNHLTIKAANGIERKLSAIILPCCKVLENESVEMLKRFQEAGGRIVTVNARVESIYSRSEKRLSSLPENGLPEDLHFNYDAENKDQLAGMIAALRQCVPQQVTMSPSACEIVSRVWRKWNRSFFMLHNATDHPLDNIHVRIECDHEPFLLDLDTNALGRMVKSKGRQHEFTRSFSAAETLILVSGDALSTTEDFMDTNSLAGTKLQIAGEWEFKPFKDNVLPLREGQVKNRDMRQIHSFRFQIREVPGRLKVVFDREMTKSELLCNRYSPNLQCLVNGRLVEDFRPGAYLDYFMFEADIAGLVKEGTNEISFEYYSMFLETDRKCHVPFIIGSFQLFAEKGGFSIGLPQELIATGDWGERGYPFYAGEAAYRRTIVLPENCRGKKLALSLGRLSNATEVLINGQSLGRRILPPWNFDISSFGGEKNLELEIRIVNTPQNLFCLERIASGLFGPVEINMGVAP
ncbi:MAG: hypothetical protein L6437_12915 [Kiritimatiellae bacterium]|nr:hypothetical protein [Kiritimatiellia bacterium]